MFEYAYKIFNSSEYVKDLFDRLIKKINLCESYEELKECLNVTRSLIGKNKSKFRSNIEERSITDKSKKSFHELFRVIRNRYKSFKE